MGTHPTNEQREATALPVLRQLLAALAGADAGAVQGTLRDDVVVLTDGGREVGAKHGAYALAAVARDAAAWDPPHQHGAHALLTFTTAGGDRRGIVVEARRDAIVFAATLSS